jgi:[ribosomal protein S5]-alanine N-acetyltransferase
MEPIYETARTLTRPLSSADVPALTGILSDPEVMKHSVRGVCDEEATRRFIEWCVGCYESHSVGPWALIEKDTSTLIGFCGVSPERVGEVEEISLGYRLARRYWGRGLATESVRGALTFAFSARACDSVVAIIEPEHVASLRVAEKSGFRKFQELVFHGRMARLYRLTHDDWTQSHNTSLRPTSGRDAASRG